MDKFIHDINALPHAGLNKDGDCAPACIGAIVNKSVKNIYDILGEIYKSNDTKIKGLCYREVISIVQKLGLTYENFLPSLTKIDQNPEYFTMGFPSWHNWMSWYELTKERLKSGYVGLAMVHLHGKSHIEDYQNHFVLIKGYIQKSTAAKNKMVVISCPTKGEYKKTAKDFLWHYGGYNTIWVKYEI